MLLQNQEAHIDKHLGLVPFGKARRERHRYKMNIEKPMHVYICENSIDGILTGIYDAWASRYGHSNNRILVKEPDNLELFCDYIYVETDAEKAAKVSNSIRDKISAEAQAMVLYSALSKDLDKAESIYRFIILGFAMGGKVIGHLSNPYVNHVASMKVNIGYEVNHYQGFLRFSELKSGVLFSRIRPANDIITILADHFDNRLEDENWLIFDEGRKKAALHRAGYPWILTHGGELEEEEYTQYTHEEIWMQNLWQHFVNTISIQERASTKRQLSMLPNRFREFMREVPYKPFR